VVKSLRKQILIQISIAVGAIIVVSIPLYLAKGDINRRILKVQELRSLFVEQVRAESSLIALKEDEAKGLAAAAVLNQYVPTRDALINFPRTLSGLASSYNLETSIVFGNQTETGGGLLSLDVDVKATGESGDILDFLKILEGGKYFIIVDSVSLTRRAAENKFEASISGRVFSRPTNI